MKKKHNRDCLDCKYCYIEDLYFEIVCKKHGYIGDDHIYQKAKKCTDYEKES